MNTNLLESSVAGIIVDGESELFTKSIAREFVFTANRSGCTFQESLLLKLQLHYKILMCKRKYWKQIT